MKNFLKTLLVLILTTVLLLTGCNTADEPYTYEKLSIKTDYKLTHIYPSLFTDEALYFFCSTVPYGDRNPLDDDYHTIRRRFFKMDFSGNTTQLSGFDHDKWGGLNGLLEDADKNLYVKSSVELGVNIGEDVERTLLKLDANGTIVQEKPLLDEDSFFQAVAEEDEYVCIGGGVFIYDSNFQRVAEIPTGIECGNVYDIFSINDSRIICVVEEDRNLHLLTIDRENRCVKESFLIENAYAAYQGNSEYDIIYYNQGEHKIYAQNLGKEPKLLVSFADYGLNVMAVTNLKFTESGDIIIVCDIDEWPDGTHSKAGESDVVILKKQ